MEAYAVIDSVSLFFPMFNEEQNIGHAVAAALHAIERVTPRGEVIVVNDGSADQTGPVADRLAAADPRVRVVHHSENRGYGAALRSGLAAARHSAVVLADGDNQFDLDELRVLLDALASADIVASYRIVRSDPWHRRLYAFLYNQLARTLFDIQIRDVNCGFKAYRRAFLEPLLPELRSTGALINVEILARARRRGARVREVGVHHYPRTAGHQTGGSPAVIVRALRELVALARELK